MSETEIHLTLMMKELSYLREKINKTIEKVNFILDSTNAQKKDIEMLNEKCLEEIQKINCAHKKWSYSNSQEGS